mmetsp:Transcript_37076/g.103160  ORF Transcript_37076/g.103160 Transcript_37076/m.103160 type:complete len:93 (-) Transcript_37076:1168-1446(-)
MDPAQKHPMPLWKQAVLVDQRWPLDSQGSRRSQQLALQHDACGPSGSSGTPIAGELLLPELPTTTDRWLQYSVLWVTRCACQWMLPTPRLNQ